jgi:multiple sugar transport system substrate-binding protein
LDLEASRGFVRLVNGRISKLAACAILVAGIILEPASVLAESGLQVWLVFNLPPARADSPQPTLDTFLDEWAHQGIDLFGLREKASGNQEFLLQLLGQGAILQQIAAFRSKNPAFPRIEIRFFGWDEYWESLRSAPAALRPDVIQVPTTWCSSLARGLGILAALPAEADRQARRRYDRKLLDPCLVYGESPLYGLPWLVDVRVLYFWRQDLPSLERDLRNTGHPRDGFRRSLQAARANVDHTLFALPTARDWELLHQLALLVWGEGGELVETHNWFGYRSHAAAFKEPALRGADYLLGLAKDRLIVLPRDTRQDLEQKFVAHQLSSVISGPWLVSQLERQGAISDGSVGVALPPLYEGEPVTFVGGSLLGVTARNQTLTARALELIEYLSAGDGSLPSAVAAGLLPALSERRGTASAAIREHAELKSGRPCATFFECTIATTDRSMFPETFEQALRAGRTYPAIPEWWTLEVPSRLGSLYHFWQELAALQSREALDGSLRAVSDEWDSSLRRFHRWMLATSGLVLSMMVASVLGFVWARRYRVRLRKREAEIIGSIEYLESQIAQEREERLGETLALLVQILSEVRKKEDDLRRPGKYFIGKIEDLVAPLQPDRDHFEIILPNQRDRQLKILKNGRALNDVDPMASRIIERVIRQSLLEQHPVSFSLLLGAMYFWPSPQELPKDVRGRWEVIVTAIRRAFDSKRWEVVSKGKNGVYDFLLDERSYSCYLSASDGDSQSERDLFITAVRVPYLEAKRLARGDPAAALGYARSAFSAQQNLLTKDVEVTTLLCRLGSLAGSSLSRDQQSVLASAHEELLRFHEQYQVFFENYQSPEAVVPAPDGLTMQGRLMVHWEKLHETWIGVREAASFIPPDASAAPPAIDKEWSTARRLVQALGPNRAREDHAFVDAYEKILRYWAETAVGVLGGVTESVKTLDPAGRYKNRLRSWAQESLGEIVLAAMLDEDGSDRAFLTARLERQLVASFRESLEHGRPHILLEIASRGDRRKEADVRGALSARTLPSDIAQCVRLLVDASQASTDGR